MSSTVIMLGWNDMTAGVVWSCCVSEATCCQPGLCPFKSNTTRGTTHTMTLQCHMKLPILSMRTWNGQHWCQSFQKSRQHIHRSQGNKFTGHGQRWVRSCGSTITCNSPLHDCYWSLMTMLTSSRLMLPRESSSYAGEWRRYCHSWKGKLLRSEWMWLVRPYLMT